VSANISVVKGAEPSVFVLSGLPTCYLPKAPGGRLTRVLEIPEAPAAGPVSRVRVPAGTHGFVCQGREGGYRPRSVYGLFL